MTPNSHSPFSSPTQKYLPGSPSDLKYLLYHHYDQFSAWDFLLRIPSAQHPSKLPQIPRQLAVA